MSTQSEPRSGIEHIKERFGSPNEFAVELRRKFEDLLHEMKDKTLARFVRFIIDHTRDFWRCRGSTEKGKHHCYIGGLAFHSITAACLGKQIVAHYLSIGMVNVNADIVVAGILLHDIGKTECYKPVEGTFQTYDMLAEPVFEKTPLDRKFHHIPVGFKILTESAIGMSERSNDVPETTLNHLLHIVLSHHGHKAWSSPVIPDSTEAYIVHAVEMMDGYVEKFYLGQPVKDIYGH